MSGLSYCLCPSGEIEEDQTSTSRLLVTASQKVNKDIFITNIVFGERHGV